MAKTETKTIERTYNIPLRKEYLKVPNWKRTKKAVSAAKQFLQRHMKSEDVRLGKHLNEELWKHGIRNPPHHVKVTVIKDDKGVVRAELFGHQIEVKKKEEKKSKLQEVAEKAGLKTVKKEAAPKEEKKAAEKKEAEEAVAPKEKETAKKEAEPQPAKAEAKKTIRRAEEAARPEEPSQNKKS